MECYLVEDLLPNYMDGICSEKTKKELERHLKSCTHCLEIAEQMQSNMEEVLIEEEKNVISIEPMKKVRHRMRRNKILIMLLCGILVMVLAATTSLTYGQICKKGVSFESVYEYLRMRNIGKEFAKGNLEPLLNVVEDSWNSNSEEYAALNLAYSTDKEAYKDEIKKQVEKRYKEYFENQNLKFNDIDVSYNMNPVELFENVITVTLEFSADNTTGYAICLRKNSGGKFYIHDIFLRYPGMESIYTYTVNGNGGATEGSISESNTEKLLDNNTQTLFYHLSDREHDLLFRVETLKVQKNYERLLQGNNNLLEYNFLWIMRSDDESPDTQNLAAETWKKQTEELINKLYYPKSLNYYVKSYDRDKCCFIYQLFVEIEEQNSKESTILSVDAYRQNTHMVLIPETAKLIGELNYSDVDNMLTSVFN